MSAPLTCEAAGCPRRATHVEFDTLAGDMSGPARVRFAACDEHFFAAAPFAEHQGRQLAPVQMAVWEGIRARIAARLARCEQDVRPEAIEEAAWDVFDWLRADINDELENWRPV
jgi:hypothetical protein